MNQDTKNRGVMIDSKKKDKILTSSSDRYDNLKYWIENGIDIEKRRISLDVEIDPYSIGLITRAIRRMVDSSWEKPIDIYINSYGGSIYDGLALYDVLESCECTTIRTHAEGKVMSIALILFLAGDERYAGPRATFMNHEGSDELGTLNLKEIKVNTKELERLENICLDILAERTKKTKNWWKKETEDRTRYYNKKQALELGIITSEEYTII